MVAIFMKVFKFLGKFVKPFVNFPQWLGWKQIVSSTRALKELAKTAFQISKGESRKESFEQAVSRLRLTEEDLKKRKKMFLRMALFYFLIGAGLFGYGIYLFVSTPYFLGGLLTLILSMLMFTYAYREHFWYFQLKARKLGCSFNDWMAFTFSLRGIQK